MAAMRVLLVEDEPLIAMMVEDFVDMLGHSLAGSVDTAAEGVRLVEGGGVDVALIDVNVRDGPSWPVADAMKARGLPYIVATGGHVDPPPVAHAGAPQLAKPFTLDGLEAALEKSAER